jgi:hypothetical protein
MKSGIALLLRGSSADLSATFYAIELARRTSRVVHAVFMERDGERPHTEMLSREEKENDAQICTQQFISLAHWLGDVEEVAVHIHMLESPAFDTVVRFICEYRIFCLILAAECQGRVEETAEWIERIRCRLTGETDCFLPPLWSLIIKPWDDPALQHIINGYKQAAWSRFSIEMLACSLRNGSKGCDHIMESKKRV